jgi:hypothetical protein
MEILDRCLDEFEVLWQKGRAPPDLVGFAAQLPEAAVAAGAHRELALIDLEHRWRLFFRPGRPLSAAGEFAGLPKLPRWSDYFLVLPACDPDWLEGACREFRVRQLFGDRPDYRDVATNCPAIVAELNRHLPELAAELTRATVSLIQDGQRIYSCPLPPRLEVGRRRVDEPPAPILLQTESGPRLLIAELTLAHISRSQFQLQVVAKDRLFVQHVAGRGYVDCMPGDRLKEDACCELPVPCQLHLKGIGLRIERRSR